jgi:predicted GH43/DUF377 family glycosyl hydrolase
MKWIKKGHIYKPSGNLSWAGSYAQIPRPLLLEDRIRIYYATRYYDALNLPISQTSFIDVEKNELRKILYIHNEPSLKLGPKGTFSHYGIHPTMLINKQEEICFFYQGWNRSESVPYETEVGMALSEDRGLSFVKTSDNPIFGKSHEDPYYVNGVFIFNRGDEYLMFYSSGKEWIEYGGRKESIYVIKSAISNDLINWQRNNREIIRPNLENECQNSATVINLYGRYHMWFCYRHALDFRNENRGYRIGYAWSDDLVKWNRDDSLAGIDISNNNDWDSQMVCYPHVFEFDGKVIMLYCGNYFGKEGFGYAELDLKSES